jgi:hypothetical protein
VVNVMGGWWNGYDGGGWSGSESSSGSDNWDW